MRRCSLVLALAACEQASPAPPPPPPPQVAPPAHELMATLERTTCYGTCPQYKLALYRDGVVEYTGTHYVELRGTAIGHVTRAQLGELEQMFADAHYFELADRYDQQQMTDMPSATTTFQLGARAKRIEHYLGDTGAPRLLENIEDSIDRVVGVERWIGSEAERERHAYEWY